MGLTPQQLEVAVNALEYAIRQLVAEPASTDARESWIQAALPAWRELRSQLVDAARETRPKRERPRRRPK